MHIGFFAGKMLIFGAWCVIFSGAALWLIGVVFLWEKALGYFCSWTKWTYYFADFVHYRKQFKEWQKASGKRWWSRQ